MYILYLFNIKKNETQIHLSRLRGYKITNREKKGGGSEREGKGGGRESET